jgi:hypothetical protein
VCASEGRAGLAGSDPDDSDERAHEHLPVFKAGLISMRERATFVRISVLRIAEKSHA